MLASSRDLRPHLVHAPETLRCLRNIGKGIGSLRAHEMRYKNSLQLVQKIVEGLCLRSDVVLQALCNPMIAMLEHHSADLVLVGHARVSDSRAGIAKEAILLGFEL